MEPTLGLANLEDVDELCRLRWQLYGEIDPEPGEAFEAYRDRFVAFAREALAADAWQAWVARSDDRLVGAAWRHRTPRIPQPGKGEPAPLAYVTNVYVEPAHRNRGLGERLIAMIVEASRSEGYSLVMVWPSDRSYPFYARGGFERSADPLTMDLRSAADAATLE